MIPFHKPFNMPESDKKYMLSKIHECIDSGILTKGEHTVHLEEMIAKMHNVDYVIATSSGTQALINAVLADCVTNMRHTNTIYTPSFAWASSKHACELSDKWLEYTDIDADSWNMIPPDTNMFAKAQNRKQLLMPLHTFGNVCEISSNYDCIYDGAHALGSNIKDIGVATIISLAPTKVITSGEGGLILTNSYRLHDVARENVLINARLSEIHAIIGLAHLKFLSKILNYKRKVFKYYKSHLDGIFQESDVSTNYNTIGMLTELKMPYTIDTRKYYKPLQKGLKNTDEIFNSIVCLPAYHSVPYKQVVADIQHFNE